MRRKEREETVEKKTWKETQIRRGNDKVEKEAEH